ncbi:MAG: helix-turn-helix domain-containing protein [Pseudohongiella nitratireducens]|nr:helix-turn-helix domain-containing protein [Pseudohongiella nitratireducens]MDF1622506.1 helix-turn-helix domain-containing protein [Pseudohongiella nitratireducens]
MPNILGIVNIDMDKCTLYRDIGQRIRSERERLGYRQAEFSAQGAVGRNSQSGYESGDRAPTAEYLARVARLGADIQFIVTGVRSKNLHELEYADPDLIIHVIDEYHQVESRDIDQKLLSRILERINSAKGLAGITATPSAHIAKVASIIYENKIHSDKRTLPSDDAIKSMFDLLDDKSSESL